MIVSPSQPPQFAPPALPPLLSTQVFGCTIRYYDVGSGSPLVLLHGIGGDADDWAFCLEALSCSHRVIAPDLLGFGRSDKPHMEYSIAGLVEVMERFLHALGIERATLLGHSLVGWIAAAFALRFPERVEKLVLVDTAGVWGDTADLPIDLHVSTLAHMREIFDYLFYDQSLATDGLIELAYRQHLERGDGYTIHSVLQNLRDGRERLDECISALKPPTLIIWGEQDRMIPVETGQHIQRLVAGSTLRIIPHCGHLPELETAAEFVRCVLEFAG